MSLDYMKLRLAYKLVLVSGDSKKQTTLDRHLIKVGTLYEFSNNFCNNSRCE
jgi:hypothetical protein